MNLPFEHLSSFGLVVAVLELLLRIGLAIRVLVRRLPTGTTFAWLFLVLSLPFVGAFCYLLFGELRLGRRRLARWQALRQPIARWLNDLARRYPRGDTLPITANALGFARLVERTFELPPAPGNELALLRDADSSMQSLIRDIDAAERTCHLEFYIWSDGGAADLVAEALIRAAERGVLCRLLVDGLGSRPFLRGAVAQRLRASGVMVREALPVKLWRMVAVRLDLRNHRKIAVIDGEIGYTGSLNMADPRFFKQSAGVGQWVDALVRVRGPAVEALAVTFLQDWELEAHEGFERLQTTGDVHAVAQAGDAVAQLLASGPHLAHYAIREVLLTAIMSAREEVILTTPYFIPDEVLLAALTAAAGRGAAITLIVPEKVDSRLVQWASQSFLHRLAAAGVRVMLYRGGLLHTKSITVDRDLSLFGSLNLDLRSLVLNFEVTLAVYDTGFATDLRSLQQGYMANAVELSTAASTASGPWRRAAETVACLLSPLL